MDNTSHCLLKGCIIMIIVGIDIGKNSHYFCVLNRGTGEVLVDATSFKNNQNGFDSLIKALEPYDKANGINLRK